MCVFYFAKASAYQSTGSNSLFNKDPETLNERSDERNLCVEIRSIYTVRHGGDSSHEKKQYALALLVSLTLKGTRTFCWHYVLVDLLTCSTLSMVRWMREQGLLS